MAVIRRHERDLEAFSRAHQILAEHAESLESEPEVHHRFISWSATQIVFHGLILCMAKTRGLIEDLRNNLERKNNVVSLTEILDAKK